MRSPFADAVVYRGWRDAGLPGWLFWVAVVIALVLVGSAFGAGVGLGILHATG